MERMVVLPEKQESKINVKKFIIRISPNIIIGKAIPLQAWIGPEDSRALRLPDFKTIET